jgi:hypothetical protein
MLRMNVRHLCKCTLIENIQHVLGHGKYWERRVLALIGWTVGQAFGRTGTLDISPARLNISNLRLNACYAPNRTQVYPKQHYEIAEP